MCPSDDRPDHPEGASAPSEVGKRTVDFAALGLTLIPAEAVHHNYVVGTWTISASNAMTKRGVSRSLCRAAEDLLSKRAFAAGSVHVLVDEAETGIIYGWVAGSKGLLQWGYVAPRCRGRGFFRSMVKRVCGRDVEYTRKPRGYRVPGYWDFNPYRMGE